MTYQESSHFHPHRTHWQDWLNVALAVWFFLSPWILQFGGVRSFTAPEMNAAWNAWVLGALVFVVSFWAASGETPWPEWLNLALAVWIFVAPWVIGFAYGTSPAAAWDHWITGAIIGVSALWNVSSAAGTMTQERHPPPRG